MRPCSSLIRYATVRRFHFTYKLHKKLRSHGIVSYCVVFVRHRHDENHRRFWANESMIVFCILFSRECVCVTFIIAKIEKGRIVHNNEMTLWKTNWKRFAHEDIKCDYKHMNEKHSIDIYIYIISCTWCSYVRAQRVLWVSLAFSCILSHDVLYERTCPHWTQWHRS